MTSFLIKIIETSYGKQPSFFRPDKLFKIDLNINLESIITEQQYCEAYNSILLVKLLAYFF